MDILHKKLHRYNTKHKYNTKPKDQNGDHYPNTHFAVAYLVWGGGIHFIHDTPRRINSETSAGVVVTILVGMLCGSIMCG